jgi:hypothetical protein
MSWATVVGAGVGATHKANTATTPNRHADDRAVAPVHAQADEDRGAVSSRDDQQMRVPRPIADRPGLARARPRRPRSFDRGVMALLIGGLGRPHGEADDQQEQHDADDRPHTGAVLGPQARSSGWPVNTGNVLRDCASRLNPAAIGALRER